MPTPKINDTTLYYETYGAGSPLVFVHGGFGASARAQAGRHPPGSSGSEKTSK